MKFLISEFLSWSKQQRTTIVILFLFILIILSMNFFISEKNSPSYKIDLELQNYLSKFNINYNPEDTIVKGLITPENIKSNLFEFDPNNLDEKKCLELGFNKKVTKNILNYLNKNGKFYKPEDLKKIYGLDGKLFYKLLPYIKIENKNKSINKYILEDKKEIKNEKIIININTNEISDWVQIKGIGIKIAERIFKYKNLLGGFYNINQIKEVYGINDSLFNNIKGSLSIENFNNYIVKININKADFKTLANHPYIKYNLAKVIIAYISQHKEIKNIEELINIKIIDEEIFEKLKHYIKTID